MFPVCRLIVLVSLVCAALGFSVKSQAATAELPATIGEVRSAAVIASDTGPSQQALPSETELTTAGVDALSHVPVLAVSVAGVSVATSLQTVGFIYGFAAIIAFLVAFLIKLMAMTLHRL